MEDEKTEFLEVVADMSQFAGALAGAAVVAGRKAIRYLNDLTIVDTILRPPAEPDRNNKTDKED